MGKSLGNSLTVEAVTYEVPPVILRSALGTVHYRSTVAYSPVTLVEAQAVWDRLAGFVARAAESEEVGLDEVASLGPDHLPAEFTAAMGDGLNVFRALAAVREAVTKGNIALSEHDSAGVRRAQLEVRSVLDIPRLDPLNPQWRSGAGSDIIDKVLDTLVADMLGHRAQARVAKGWATASTVRDSLSAAGVIVESSPEGVRQHVEGR